LFEHLFSQLDTLVPSDPKARSRFLTPHKSSVRRFCSTSLFMIEYSVLNCAHRLNRMRAGGLSLHSLRIDRSATLFLRRSDLSPRRLRLQLERSDRTLCWKYRSMRSVLRRFRDSSTHFPDVLRVRLLRIRPPFFIVEPKIWFANKRLLSRIGASASSDKLFVYVRTVKFGCIEERDAFFDGLHESPQCLDSCQGRVRSCRWHSCSRIHF